MKLTLGSNRFNKQIAQTQQQNQQATNPNPNFSDDFLKQQLFYKPKFDYGQHSSNGNYKQTSILNPPKRIQNGMGNSFMSGHSSNRLKTKGQQNYQKMIIKLSHQLLVKDSMIDSLRCELMANHNTQNTIRTEEEEKQATIRGKPSYHFKTLINANGYDNEEEISRRKLTDGLSIYQRRSSEGLSLEEKATLSQSQFVRVHSKNSQQLLPNRKPDSLRVNVKKSNQRINYTELQENLRLKDRQLQVVLSEKKLLTQKLVQNQRSMISKDVQIKSLKNQLKKADISKDEINKSIDSKKVVEYEERIARLKKQNLFLTTNIQQLKKSKGQEIQLSIKQWKKINQTMTDSLVKLNHENSVLTKKITDLEVRLTTSCTKTSELEKQNHTLKYNLQNQKNSYNTLSMHHKHEKDESNRRISQLQKEIDKLRQRAQGYRLEKENSENILKEKQDALIVAEAELHANSIKYESEICRLKESNADEIRHQREIKKLLEKDLQLTTSSLKTLEAQISKDKEYKSTIEKQLTSANKNIQDYKAKQNQKNKEVEHYKNKVSELVQKVSEMKIEKIHQTVKQTCMNRNDDVQQRDMEREQALFQNQTLKYKIEQLLKQINEDPELSKRYMNDLEIQIKKRENVQQVNRRLGEKIRKCEQELLSLKSRIKQSSNSDSENQSENQDLMSSPTPNYNSVVDHNQMLTHQLNQRQQVIYDLRESLRRQQDNTINLKIHLDDVNRRLSTHIEMLDCCNKTLISKELHLANCTLEAQQIIEQLKQDNEGLEKQLKVIYQKLEYFEHKLCESSQIENDKLLQSKHKRFSKFSSVDRVEENEDGYDSSLVERSSSQDQNDYNSD